MYTHTRTHSYAPLGITGRIGWQPSSFRMKAVNLAKSLAVPDGAHPHQLRMPRPHCYCMLFQRWSHLEQLKPKLEDQWRFRLPGLLSGTGGQPCGRHN